MDLLLNGVFNLTEKSKEQY